jgi:hypothetical protein
MKKIILTSIFTFATILGFAQEIKKAIDKNGNFFLEKDGKRIVKDTFEKVGYYNQDANLIPAKLGGKWGFYDNVGKLVIPHQFEGLVFQNVAALVGWYVQDKMEVMLNGRRYFIDKTGNEVSAPEYELVIETTYEGAGYFFKKDGKWALADKNRKVLTEFKYDKILGPIGVNPFVFRGIRDGKDFRLDASGKEEASIESINNSGDNSASKNEKATSCTYKCQKCNKTAQGKCNSNQNGIAVENCLAQQPDPKGPRKNHEWRKL